ncbi:hypothetical protein B0H13DRAFT_1877233 [Mycena leptocephala]|nr:hypothetical protein B0H13DRAFT_1877233 [Mycena leptocephala]
MHMQIVPIRKRPSLYFALNVYRVDTTSPRRPWPTLYLESHVGAFRSPCLKMWFALGQLVAAGFLGSVSGGEAEPVYYITLPLATTGFSLSMCVNTLVTGLIAGKIWIFRDEGEKNEDEPYNHVITLMVESGLMNFVIQLLYLVLNLLENPAFSLVETCTVHFYLTRGLKGITPTLLGIRVITGKSIDSYAKASRSLAFASRGARDTTLSVETGRVQPQQTPGGQLFDHEFASKEVTMVGRENAKV